MAKRRGLVALVTISLTVAILPSVCLASDGRRRTANGPLATADKVRDQPKQYLVAATDVEYTEDLLPVTDVADRRVRRSAANIGNAGEKRRDGAAIRHHHHLQSQRQQQEQEKPGAGQQPLIPRGTWQSRERNKQARLFLIQTQIMSSLKLTSRPNVTGRVHNMTDEELDSLRARLSAASDDDDDDDGQTESNLDASDVVSLSAAAAARRRFRPGADRQTTAAVRHRQHGRGSLQSNKRIYVLLPTCTIPSRLKSSRFFALNGDASGQPHALRLYFNTDALTVGRRRGGSRKIGREGREGDGAVAVAGANLRLYWRGQSRNNDNSRRSGSAGGGAAGDSSPAASVENVTSGKAKSAKRRTTGVTETPSSGGAVRGVRGLRGRGLRARMFRRAAKIEKEEPTVEIAVYQLSTSSLGGARRRVRQGDADITESQQPLKTLTLRRVNKPRWITLDVTTAVDEWIKDPNRNYGLQVVVTSRPGTGLSPARNSGTHRQPSQILLTLNPLAVLDGFDCTNQRARLAADDRSQQDVRSNSTWRSAAPPTDGDPGSGIRHLSTGSDYPKLEVAVVRTSPSQTAPPPTPSATSGDRQRKREGRKTRRRDRRHVADDRATPLPCAVEHFNVSFRDFGWSWAIFDPPQYRFSYCDTPNPCPASDDSVGRTMPFYSTRSQKRSEFFECCESVERQLSLTSTVRDPATGDDGTFSYVIPDVIECRRRNVYLAL